MSARPAGRSIPRARRALETVLELLAEERASVSSVTEPARAWKVHVDDSLTGLEVEALARLRGSPILALELGFRAWSWQWPCPPRGST